ncbi:MAG: TIGR04086 family membrane protein [Veillonellales bacterium]
MAKYTGRTRGNTKLQKPSGAVVLIFLGAIVSLAVSLVCTLFLSLVSLLSEGFFIERYMEYIMVAVTMVSIFIGSVFAAQKAESKGLLIGIAVGFIYVIVSVAVGMKISQETITLLVFANKFVAGIAAGALGGLIGINL